MQDTAISSANGTRLRPFSPPFFSRRALPHQWYLSRHDPSRITPLLLVATIYKYLRHNCSTRGKACSTPPVHSPQGFFVLERKPSSPASSPLHYRKRLWNMIHARLRAGSAGERYTASVDGFAPRDVVHLLHRSRRGGEFIWWRSSVGSLGVGFGGDD